MKMPSSNITRPLLALAVAASVATGAGGCAYLQQAQDNPVFTAHPDAARAQVLNPDASRNRKAVAGLDGTVAKNVNEGYTKSFEKKQSAERASVSFIGLSGVGND